MVERKTPFRGKREYYTFGEGFPGFGETDELKASRWSADLFEEAPVSEPENEPVAYTGDEDFSTRGRYSGVGVIVDETGEFDPEPVRCGSAGSTSGKNAKPVRRDSTESALVNRPEPACRETSEPAYRESPKPTATSSSPKPAAAAEPATPAAPASNPEPAQSVEAKLDLSLFRELYRSRDGRLVFFEHRATGHLAAVDASKLV
ncbi:hypothetical protein [uncultured Ellagibacter sp.]|uniref:hypothetical protein n=1 Tax=uncultured Ellagibacter sp. TaxID=2137580 RepID=UPI0026109332|nr:hypothetical protein [uncultured Ellagibacter sp.]